MLCELPKNVKIFVIIKGKKPGEVIVKLLTDHREAIGFLDQRSKLKPEIGEFWSCLINPSKKEGIFYFVPIKRVQKRDLPVANVKFSDNVVHVIYDVEPRGIKEDIVLAPSFQYDKKYVMIIATVTFKNESHSFYIHSKEDLKKYEKTIPSSILSAYLEDRSKEETRRKTLEEKWRRYISDLKKKIIVTSLETKLHELTINEVYFEHIFDDVNWGKYESSGDYMGTIIHSKRGKEYGDAFNNIPDPNFSIDMEEQFGIESPLWENEIQRNENFNRKYIEEIQTLSHEAKLKFYNDLLRIYGNNCVRARSKLKDLENFKLKMYVER